MKAETKKKLEELAKFIETIPDKQFNMSEWLGVDNHTKYKKNAINSEYVGKSLVGKCGTTCCIAGWEVVRNGFLLNQNGYVAVEVTVPGVKKPQVATLNDYNYNYAPDFATKSLGLTEKEEKLLFYPEGWPGYDEGSKENYWTETNTQFPNTPKGAAARIRHLIKTGK